MVAPRAAFGAIYSLWFGFGAACSRAASKLATRASSDSWLLDVPNKFEVQDNWSNLEAESDPRLHNLKSDPTQVLTGPRKTFVFESF